MSLPYIQARVQLPSDTPRSLPVQPVQAFHKKWVLQSFHRISISNFGAQQKPIRKSGMDPIEFRVLVQVVPVVGEPSDRGIDYRS
jgi:hypothetical protein